MLVEKYIDHDIPVLKTSDTIRTAIKKFEETKLEHLPVVYNDYFLGILHRNTAESVLDTKLKLEGIRLEGQSLNVTPHSHVLEALKHMHETQLDVLGVVENNSTKYIGSVKKEHLLAYFSDMYGTRANGSVLVLNIVERDYSLSELSRLVEDNGSKILSLFADIRDDDPYHILITLKLSLADLSRVIAALQRHNYIILYSSHKEEFQNKDKDRLEHLLRFLEI